MNYCTRILLVLLLAHATCVCAQYYVYYRKEFPKTCSTSSKDRNCCWHTENVTSPLRPPVMPPRVNASLPIVQFDAYLPFKEYAFFQNYSGDDGVCFYAGRWNITFDLAPLLARRAPSNKPFRYTSDLSWWIPKEANTTTFIMPLYDSTPDWGRMDPVRWKAIDNCILASDASRLFCRIDWGDLTNYNRENSNMLVTVALIDSDAAATRLLSWNEYPAELRNRDIALGFGIFFGVVIAFGLFGLFMNLCCRRGSSKTSKDADPEKAQQRKEQREPLLPRKPSPPRRVLDPPPPPVTVTPDPEAGSSNFNKPLPPPRSGELPPIKGAKPRPPSEAGAALIANPRLFFQGVSSAYARGWKQA